MDYCVEEAAVFACCLDAEAAFVCLDEVLAADAFRYPVARRASTRSTKIARRSSEWVCFILNS